MSWQMRCLTTLLLLAVALGQGQTPAVSKEYIYLGGRVVAVETHGSTGVQISLVPLGPVLLSGGQSQLFTATVSSGSVNWEIAPAGVGSLVPNGNQAQYTAPATVASGQTLTITARSATDSSKTATATVELQVPSQVSISPQGPVSLSAGQYADFTAALSGTLTGNVTWSVAPTGIGSLVEDSQDNKQARYTAPATVASN